MYVCTYTYTYSCMHICTRGTAQRYLLAFSATVNISFSIRSFSFKRACRDASDSFEACKHVREYCNMKITCLCMSENIYIYIYIYIIMSDVYMYAHAVCARM